MNIQLFRTGTYLDTIGDIGWSEARKADTIEILSALCAVLQLLKTRQRVQPMPSFQYEEYVREGIINVAHQAEVLFCRTLSFADLRHSQNIVNSFKYDLVAIQKELLDL